jgi:hypothetical protein
VKRPVTVEETFCDRCDRKVARAGGKFALTPLGPIEVDEGPMDDHVAGHDEAGALVQTWPTVDLCRNCKVSLLGWWKRPSRDEDEPESPQAELPETKPEPPAKGKAAKAS